MRTLLVVTLGVEFDRRPMEILATSKRPSCLRFDNVRLQCRAFQFSLILRLMASRALTGLAQKVRNWAARFFTPRVCSTFSTLLRNAESMIGAEHFLTRQASSPRV